MIFFSHILFFLSFSLTLISPHTYSLSPSPRIEVREVGGRKVIVFAQQEAEDTSVATIVIRASTEHVLNDVEVHYLHDIISGYQIIIIPTSVPTRTLRLPIRLFKLPLLQPLLTIIYCYLNLFNFFIFNFIFFLLLFRELLMMESTLYVCCVRTSVSYPVLVLWNLSCARGERLNS